MGEETPKTCKRCHRRGTVISDGALNWRCTHPSCGKSWRKNPVKGGPGRPLTPKKEREPTPAVHYLEFSPKCADESEGDYRFRKFEEFCEKYTCHVHGKFAGKPVKLMQWQRVIIKKTLGTLDENEKRIYKKLLIHIGRKNGKTFLICLLILYWIAEESRRDPAAEVVSCANTRDQSIKTIFRTCRLIIGYSKELTQLLKIGIQPPYIMNGLNNGIYEPLSADGKPNLGKNLSLIVFDETLGQPNEEMWSAMETSQGLRDEPLFVSASTAGNSRSSFYYIIYELMKDIQADPASAPDTLVSIFEVPEEMDWKLPEAFMLANPAAGEGGFRDPEEIKKMLAKAVKSEGTAAFRQFYLNQWAQYGQRTLVSLNKWDLCKVLDLDLTPEMKECRVVGGLDLSSTTDLTGVGIIIEPLGGTKIWIIFTFAWLAGEDLSECSKRDHLPYEKWEEGDIIFFDGKPTIQIEAVLDILIKLKTHFPKFEKLGYDPYLIAKEPMGENETKAYNSKQESLLKLIEPYFELIPVPQQYAFLSPAVKRLKTKILDKEIQHDGNPLLRSCIENARVLEDASGNIRLDKSKSTSRIDPLIALIIAGTIALKEGFR